MSQRMLNTGKKLFHALFFLTQFLLSRAEFQVATGKPAMQSSTFAYFIASGAVDGNKGDGHMNGCSHTLHRLYTAWWRVDLERLYSIRRIVIYPRPRNTSESQGRFAGISVAVSEYEETGYHTCFDYGKNGPLPDLLITHNVSCTPPAEGRYVMISNYRNDAPYGAGYSTYAFVNMCEVEIFVEDCFDNHDNCTDCVCSTCKSGFYGVSCNRTCSGYCGGNGTCSQDDGRCQSCLRGYYGEHCNMTCSSNCMQNTCQFDDGNCECNGNFHGTNCSKTCLQCGGNETCDMMTGHCKHGCNSTFYGMFCELKCPENCGGNGECTTTDGACNNGCRAGWKGNFCNIECGNNTFGENCSETCGKCKENLCHHVTGTCLQGCQDGWSSLLCDIECGNNTFGESCSETCGKCKENVCHHVNGTCLQGCQDGWSSLLCDIEDDNNNAAMLGGVIGGCIVGVTLVLLGIFAFIFVLRRRYRNKTKENEALVPSCYPPASEDRVDTSLHTPSSATGIQLSEVNSTESRN